jgi:citrate lyase subunit beta/citryl-CoA lyase
MTALARPRRSVLYVPGSNARAIGKARQLPVDGIIFDLEDAVAPAQKPEARRNVVAALATGGYGERELVVRCNGLDTEWATADIAAIAASSADALLVPKVSDTAAVLAAEAALARHAAPSSLAIWCMMETPKGILNAQAIAAGSPPW